MFITPIQTTQNYKSQIKNNSPSFRSVDIIVDPITSQTRVIVRSADGIGKYFVRFCDYAAGMLNENLLVSEKALYATELLEKHTEKCTKGINLMKIRSAMTSVVSDAILQLQESVSSRGEAYRLSEVKINELRDTVKLAKPVYDNFDGEKTGHALFFKLR